MDPLFHVDIQIHIGFRLTQDVSENNFDQPDLGHCLTALIVQDLDHGGVGLWTELSDIIPKLLLFLGHLWPPGRISGLSRLP